MDNAIVVQEAIHCFRRNMGRVGNMMLKLDLKKAFDRLEWSFIRKLLHNLGFPTFLITLSMNCISSASISIMVHGKPTTFFEPSRGIRQGDPLPPYIFIICM